MAIELQRKISMHGAVTQSVLSFSPTNVSHVVPIANSDADDDDEEDFDDSDDDNNSCCAFGRAAGRCLCFTNCWREIKKISCPIFWPIFCLATLFFSIVAIPIGRLLRIFREGLFPRPPYEICAIILVTVLAFLLAFLSLRCLIRLFSKCMCREDRLCASINAILDPQFYYLCWSALNCLFWWLSLRKVEFDHTDTTVEFYTPNFLEKYNFIPLTTFDTKIIYGSGLIMMLWCTKDFLVGIVMFYFMIGFLMNLNDRVVMYLQLYSLIRRLNASCIKLTRVPPSSTPSLDAEVQPSELYKRGCFEDDPTTVIDVAHSKLNHFNSDHNYEGLPTPRRSIARRFWNSITGRRRREYAPGDALDDPHKCLSKDLGTPTSTKLAGGKLGSVAMSDCTMANSVMLRGRMMPSMSRCSSNAKLYTKQSSYYHSRKVSKATRSAISGTLENFAPQLAKFPNLIMATVRPHRKANKEKARQYHVEFTGRALPRALSRKNIDRAKQNSMQNFLAVQFIKEFPPTLFINGTRVEILRKSLAQEACSRLFDELIAFRSLITPQVVSAFPAPQSSTLEDAPAAPDLEGFQILNQLGVESDAFSLAASNQDQLPLQAAHQTQQHYEDVITDYVPHPRNEIFFAGADYSFQDANNDSASESEWGGDTNFPVIPSDVIPVDATKICIIQPSSPDTTSDVCRAFPEDGQPPGYLAANNLPQFELSTIPEESGTIPTCSDSGSPPYWRESDAHLQDLSSPPKEPFTLKRNDIDLQAATKKTEKGGLGVPKIGGPKIGNPTCEEQGQKRHLIWNPSVLRYLGPHSDDLRWTPSSQRKVNIRSGTESDSEYLTKDFLEIFMKPEEVDEFMRKADYGGHGKISKSVFSRMGIELYKTRKQLVGITDSHNGIYAVFERMVNIVVFGALLVIPLLAAGVNVNTIVISGVASLGSLAVALSFIYSSFVQSVLFVVFLNPYNIGDRVRIQGGPIMVVKEITTFHTTFLTIQGRPVIYNHNSLVAKAITNESRSTNAVFDIDIRVSHLTSPRKIRLLNRAVERYVRMRPLQFKKDSYYFLVNNIATGNYIELQFWVSVVESWHNWKVVWQLRSEVLLVIIRCCINIKITYLPPVQRIDGKIGKDVIYQD